MRHEYLMCNILPLPLCFLTHTSRIPTYNIRIWYVFYTWFDKKRFYVAGLTFVSCISHGWQQKLAMLQKFVQIFEVKSKKDFFPGMGFTVLSKSVRTCNTENARMSFVQCPSVRFLICSQPELYEDQNGHWKTFWEDISPELDSMV
jgi:hypothetical protein